MQQSSSIRNQRGESIIEVVIATVVFAVGILGNLGLQSASVQNNKSALHQTKAFIAANDIAERIRANRTAALLGDYDQYRSSNVPTDPGCGNRPCTDREIASHQLFDWSHNFANVYGDERFIGLLPGGAGEIDYNPADETYQVQISWIEQAYEQANGSAVKQDRRRTHSLVLAL